MEIKPKKSLKHLFNRDEAHFAVSFLIVFSVSFITLYAIGLIPTEFRSNGDQTLVDTLQQESLRGLGLGDKPIEVVSSEQEQNTLPPIRIVSADISLDYKIVNPTSADYTTLNNALVEGAVHYPGSGSVLSGNMFLFGHSTSYKVVNNKAYQVFNNIHLLEKGDEISIYTGEKSYIYKVESVELVDGREELVDLSSANRMLTLSTCDSFGAETNRYVVKASFSRSIDI